MQTWTKGSFKITLNSKVPQTPGDLGIRHGYICGAFGICKRPGAPRDDTWSLSHTPSGLHCNDYRSLPDAKAAVARLMLMDVDWNLPRPLPTVVGPIHAEYKRCL